MDLVTLADLCSPAGLEALEAATALSPSEESFLRHFGRLAKRFPRELARAALTTALLRHKARAKFSRAGRMFFTREALEQSSGEAVAQHRARRFAPFGRAGDFCCGIGGDSLALADHTFVDAIDLDSLRLAMARANACACGVAGRVTFTSGDLLSMPLPDVPAAFFDPDRRAGGRRHVAIRDCVPALDALRARLPAGTALGVKLAPAVSWDELRAYDAEVEFISVAGEMKECVLWFGALRSGAGRRASLLGPEGLHEMAGPPLPPPAPTGPGGWLYDPDPAILRAGLLGNLAEAVGARPIDEQIGFLTTTEERVTPFARRYAIEEALPFHAGRLRDLLRARGAGRVTVLKRGSAVDPEQLVRQLKLSGTEARVLVLTRVLGKPFALLAR